MTAKRGKRPSTSLMPGQLKPSSEKAYNNRNSNSYGDGKTSDDGNNVADDINNAENDFNDEPNEPALRRKLSAYIRGITASPFPVLNDSGDGRDNTNASEQDEVGGGDQGTSITAAAAGQTREASESSGRRGSGVVLAAKRAATRKRRERAEEEAREQVDTKTGECFNSDISRVAALSISMP